MCGCMCVCALCVQVKVWEIPSHGLMKNLTVPWKELQGHSRRVGLIEWHPTANNILFSTAYDYQVAQKHTRLETINCNKDNCSMFEFQSSQADHRCLSQPSSRCRRIIEVILCFTLSLNKGFLTASWIHLILRHVFICWWASIGSWEKKNKLWFKVQVDKADLFFLFF